MTLASLKAFDDDALRELEAFGSIHDFAFGEVLDVDVVSPLIVVIEGRVRVLQPEDEQERPVVSLAAGEVLTRELLDALGPGVALRASTAGRYLSFDKQSWARLVEAAPRLVGHAEGAGARTAMRAWLGHSSELRGMGSATLSALADQAVPVEIPEGTVLVHAGDVASQAFVARAGTLALVSGSGPTERVVGHATTGQVVGASAVEARGRYPFTIRAAGKCTLLVLSKRLVDQIATEQAFAPLARAEARLERAVSGTTDAPRPLSLLSGFAGRGTRAADGPGPTRVDAGAPAASEEHPYTTEHGFFRSARTPIRRFPIVRQIDEADCGAACLAMIGRFYGRRVGLTLVRELSRTRPDGVRLRDLCGAAAELGLAARSVRVSPRNVERVPLPAIIHWDNYHWVVLYRVTGERAYLADPDVGPVSVTREELGKRWNGHAALFDFTDGFSNAPEETHSYLALLKFYRPFSGVFGRALALAAVEAGVTALLPVVSQLVVDRVVVDGVEGALTGIMLSMVAALFFLSATSALRGYFLAFVAVRVDAASLDYLTRKLLALPMSYFQGRRTGDIQRRLEGVYHVRETVVTMGFAALFALVQLVVALLMMCFYSRTLTLTYLAVLPLYAGLMWFSARYLKPLFDRLESSHSRYRSDQLDAIKGIEAVKAGGAELAFRDQLLSRFLGVAREQFRADFASIGYQGATHAVAFLSSIVFLWVGARLAMAGGISLGTLVAFTSLVALANAPIDVVLTFWDRTQLVRVLLDRLRDVFDSTPEQGTDRSALKPVPSISGAFELRGLSFGYEGPNGPMILRGIDLRVRAGERVAIVGRSGSGKTTLAKLLAGLIEPTGGSILFDGIASTTLNYRQLRQHIGFVLQRDYMFASSVAENIAFGSTVNIDRVVTAAKLAGAHGFVLDLPLGFDTIIGESGISLSGGQSQRIGIARALYRQPKLLIFDEATSALDTESELAIQESLGAIMSRCTSVTIAHRLSTIRDADTILVLERGEIVESGNHAHLMARRGFYHALVARQVEQ